MTDQGKLERIPSGVSPERMKELKAAVVASRLLEIIGEKHLSPVAAFKEYVRKLTGSGDLFFENFERFFSKTFDIPVRSERIAEAEISLFYKFLNPAAASSTAFQQPRGEGYPESESIFSPEVFGEIKREMKEKDIDSGEALASIIDEGIEKIVDEQKMTQSIKAIPLRKHFDIFRQVMGKILDREPDYYLAEDYSPESDRLLYLLYYPRNYRDLFSPSTQS